MNDWFGFVPSPVDPEICNDDSHSTFPICPELLRAGQLLAGDTCWTVDKNQSQMALCGGNG